MLFTSVPVNALNVSGNDLSESTANKESTESIDTSSAELATNSDALSEDTSILEISSNDIDSSEEKLNNKISLQSDDTEDEEELSTDNWELGLVFYDSTVDNGKTPLTSIDWDASDGGYGKTDPRVITVQINYKNTNAVTTYEPGKLEISIPNLIYGTGYTTGSGASWLSSVIVGANDSSHTGYDWNFSTGNEPDRYQQIYTFTNANIIEEKSNFEGSIQIVYNIEPVPENFCYGKAGSQTNKPTPNYPIEHGKDSCLHTKEQTLKATLKDILESNEIFFKYRREYIHPWEEASYSITKTASKISSYDGLGENPQDYYWVKFIFTETPTTDNAYYYPTLYALNRYFKEVLPEGSVCYNSSMEEILPNENNEYIITDNIDPWNQNCQIFVGYPKALYSEDNLSITNEVELYGTYYTREEEKLLAEATCNINLADFEFQYDGELYAISKTKRNFSDSMYYQYIVDNQDDSQWILNPKTYYTGKPLTVKIGDDLLYATNDEGNYEKLNDNEYFFSYIGWVSTRFRNTNHSIIDEEKYDCELWIRYADASEYVQYDTFKNKSKSWRFSREDGIVGFYFIINDMKEGIDTYIQNWSPTYGLVEATTCFNKKDIPESGRLYNFGYLQTYVKDEKGNLILQNEPNRDSYASYITQEIADFDQETYGTYMQRSMAYNTWSYHNVHQLLTYISAYKSNTYQITQDVSNEQFLGLFDIGAALQGTWCIEKDFFNDYKSSYAIKGYKVYDLLPEGMELTSTKEEIANSIKVKDSSSFTKNAYDIEGNIVSNSELVLNTKSEVTVTPNWNNTGRTKIEIIATFKEPIYFTGGSTTQSAGISSSSDKYFYYTYNYTISYDSFLEYGNVWMNDCFAEKLDGQENSLMKNTKVDEMDINENGEKENLGYAKASATITSVVSTHQDVTKYVQTDKSNYSTGTVKASPDSEYTYKLRVRTGQNDVTNLVIYDSVEEYAQDKDGNIVPAYGTKKHWNGSFLGIDTSYAEAKGYVVKPYYSENKLAGNLYNEDGSLNTDWKEYSDSVDKSKVKSLAFEYLNKDDESLKAVLPANSQTYVLVKMQAPPEENRKILAYNGCRTQWQALDDYDRPVDFITGINSNIVKVSLSDYYDLTVNKVWNDENNKWGLRPDSVDIILKKDGTEVERKQITKDNLSVTFTDLLVEDSDRYTIEEELLSLYSSAIEYNELEDCYEVTNTLKDDIFTDVSGTKTWVGDKESKRPESITIKLLKDGEIYRTTTTNAEKDWKYSFEKIPIYNVDGTECVYSVEEVPIEKYSVQYTTPSNGLAIKFNSKFNTESVSYDYVEIYYKQDGQTFKLGKWGGTTLAGQTVNVPTKDFYLYWRTDGSGNNYYGFSIDSIEAADVDTTGTAATLPNYTATELTGNEYPETAHNPYPNSQNLLWHYTGEPDNEFNIINTYEGIDAVNLSFVKAIEGTDEAFEKLQLNKDNLYKFQISMKNRETGNIISVPIDNKNTVTVNEVPVGTYVITEKDDMYFDFVSMETLNSVEGVTFEKVGNDYVLTITENASEEETLQVKVNNKIEPDRPYEDKEEKENLFSWKDESIEPTSYIVYWYDNDGNYIKAPETRTGIVGTTVHATSGDKNVPDYEYDEDNPLNIESKVLAKDENNELKLYFNKL